MCFSGEKKAVFLSMWSLLFSTMIIPSPVWNTHEDRQTSLKWTNMFLSEFLTLETYFPWTLGEFQCVVFPTLLSWHSVTFYWIAYLIVFLRTGAANRLSPSHKSENVFLSHFWFTEWFVIVWLIWVFTLVVTLFLFPGKHLAF